MFHAISSKYIWMCFCPINHVCRDTPGALSQPCVSCSQSSWFVCWAGGMASGICHQDSMKDQERQPPVLNIMYRCQRSPRESRTVQIQSWLLLSAREGIEKSQGHERKNSTPCLGAHAQHPAKVPKRVASVSCGLPRDFCDTEWSVEERAGRNHRQVSTEWGGKKYPSFTCSPMALSWVTIKK